MSESNTIAECFIKRNLILYSPLKYVELKVTSFVLGLHGSFLVVLTLVHG